MNLEDPQSWNMYSYVTDNPTTLDDPTGLSGEGCKPHLKNCATPPSKRQVRAATFTSSSTRVSAGGNVIVTTTTVTATFNKKTGKLIKATTETTTQTVGADALGRNVVLNQTNSGPRTLTAGQFLNFLDSQPMRVDPGPVVWFVNATAQDVIDHPGKYILFGAGMVTPFTEIPAEVEGIIAGAKSLYGAYELDDEMQGVAGQ